jgi:hypothetical protein
LVSSIVTRPLFNLGDFADLEEREMVLRDQDGEAVCVGRQLIMWRRPLKKGEKL